MAAMPHVLIFPFPAQGNVNPMLQLAELFSMAGGIHVTFLNSEFNHKRLLESSDAQTRLSQFPTFRFETIADGLPANHTRAFRPLNDVMHTLNTAMQAGFREKLLSRQLESDGWPPVTCIIADGLLTFTIDVAKELGVPSISFRTASACYFWACFCIPKLIEAGELPFGEGADLDELITSVPSMKRFRRRDLPSFCRAKELSDSGLQIVKNETQKALRATAQLFNTFEDLEGPILDQLRPHFPKIYTVGPLHTLLRSRRVNYIPPSSTYNNLLDIDRSCMKWLDCQPNKSVLYVSFGSVAMMTQKEMLEIWHGLANSKQRFLWVIRANSVVDQDEKYNDESEELREATKDRGRMVRWCPQEEVLIHPAVGGFMTHSGWNSTLESLVAGIPMICWPNFADQQPNSRFVSEVWKVGLDMKDKCDRKTVERMVRDLMKDKRDELMRLEMMAEMAKMSVSEGGSSDCNVDKLIQDIKSMNI